MINGFLDGGPQPRACGEARLVAKTRSARRRYHGLANRSRPDSSSAASGRSCAWLYEMNASIARRRARAGGKCACCRQSGPSPKSRSVAASALAAVPRARRTRRSFSARCRSGDFDRTGLGRAPPHRHRLDRIGSVELGRARRPEEVALAELAADRGQPVELFGLLDPFGDRLEPERVRQAHDRGGDRAAVGPSTDAGYERPVDLERLDRAAAPGRPSTSSRCRSRRSRGAGRACATR